MPGTDTRLPGAHNHRQIRYHKEVADAPSEVFISYSNDAKRWAQKLSKSLEDKNVPNWIDLNIKPGQRWLEEIERALDKAKRFLIVVGPSNQTGEWQDREWRGALERTWNDPNKRIIPILIDDAAPPSFLKAWVPLRVGSSEPESSWIDEVFNTIRGQEPAGKQTAFIAKPSKAFLTRFAEMEVAANLLKSGKGR